VIIEGKHNSLPSKCAWLIEIDEPRNNRSVLLNINEFSGSCGNRRLNIYDGSSVRSPLLAVVSNIISTGAKAKPLLQLKAKSGSAFIVLAGKEQKSNGGDCWFNASYSFEKECSITCGSHGFCSQKSSHTCECDAGWMSNNCSMPTCPVLCNNNSCNVNTRICNCSDGLTGESCEFSDKGSFWSSPVANNQDILDGVASHAMVVIGNYIWMYGGLSFSKGPVDTLARYSIKENTWEIIQASSEKNQGPAARYGHSFVAFNKSLILFGGICQGVVSNETWIFNTVSSRWMLLEISNLVDKPLGVTGHTATVVGHDMIVLFGYNPEIGFVNKIQVFSLVTREWSFKRWAPSIVKPTYGHRSVHDPRTGRIYIHGGYTVLNNTCHVISSDTFYYHPKNNEWNTLRSSGVSRFLHSAVLVGNSMIVYGGRGDHGFSSQHLMLFDVDRNEWKIPRDSALPKTVSRYGHAAVQVNSVMYAFGGFRGNMMNTFLQYSLGDCLSPGSSLDCFSSVSSSPSPNTLLSPADVCTSHNPQEDRCHQRHTCQECISLDSDDSCVWCESHNLCVSRTVYDVTFPYLQCMQVLERGKGTCSSLKCEGMKSCRDCHMLPGCGWCDDGSGTGLGKCIQGGDHGPFPPPWNSNSSATCSKPHWNFIDCPACQCNGHSKCIKENSCGECQHDTTGSHCEQCAKGFYGDPRNGGICKVCQCTAHAKSCDAATGECQCLTMGVKGKTCDECDTSAGYYGNASKGGSCYYSFAAAVKTFNLTGLERLSFAYYPKAVKRDIKLELKWTEESLGSKAKVNLTKFFALRPDDAEELELSNKPVLPHEPLKKMIYYMDNDFDHEDKFGLRGYVFDIDSTGKSAMLTVSITQPSETIDLLEFFLTFFGCFLSLLVIAGVVWKIRNRYVNFVLNRQRREERQKMASRPFAKIPVLLHDHYKSIPGPVAVETCENGKAAVFTVLMRLPGTEDCFAPIGQSGVCFASVLGTHGDSAGITPSGKATRIRTHKRCKGTCV